MEVFLDTPLSLLRQARERAGLSLRAAAGRAATSHATLSAYETGRKVPGVSTYLRLLRAYGYAADIELSRRIRDVGGLRRGDELEAVLELAGKFPAHHAKTLPYPRFGVP